MLANGRGSPSEQQGERDLADSAVRACGLDRNLVIVSATRKRGNTANSSLTRRTYYEFAASISQSYDQGRRVRPRFTMAVSGTPDLKQYCWDMARAAKQASVELVRASGRQRNDWLRQSASLLRGPWPKTLQNCADDVFWVLPSISISTALRGKQQELALNRLPVTLA